MTRRELFRRLALAGGAVAFGYPFLSFVSRQRYRPPREVKIRKPLQKGERVEEKDFVLFMTGDGPVAVSRHCTHLGCILTFVPEEELFICPCHQSRFKPDGTYVSGPARKDLPRFQVQALEGGGFKVLIPKGAG